MDERLSFFLIDDAYNANPASMAAALEVLAATEPVDGIGRVSQGRRIAFWAICWSLGKPSNRLHRALATCLDGRHFTGALRRPRMRALFPNCPRRNAVMGGNGAGTGGHVHRLIDAGDVILVKGSLGSKVSLVVDAIRKLGHPLAELGEEHR